MKRRFFLLSSLGLSTLLSGAVNPAHAQEASFKRVIAVPFNEAEKLLKGLPEHEFLAERSNENKLDVIHIISADNSAHIIDKYLASHDTSKPAVTTATKVDNMRVAQSVARMSGSAVVGTESFDAFKVGVLEKGRNIYVSFFQSSQFSVSGMTYALPQVEQRMENIPEGSGFVAVYKPDVKVRLLQPFVVIGE